MKETDFVTFLASTFPFSFGQGIGDDASVVKTGDYYQLVSKDILIENVHFSLDYFNLRELALKSLAVNISDIAAMGGEPQYFYLGLGYPQPTLPIEPIEKNGPIEFFRGLEKGCRQWHVELAGGDYSSSAIMFISITMVGKAKNPVYRHNAQIGDLVGITGITGESAIGLKLLQKGIRSGYFVEKHKQVVPEIKAGLILSRYANAMIDLSDGLLLDLKRILGDSQKGAHLWYERLPVTKQIKEICSRNGWDEYETVLAGGEDYELLFTISKENEIKLKKENKDLAYHIIGEVTGDVGSLSVEDKGKLIETPRLGYDHFQRKPQPK